MARRSEKKKPKPTTKRHYPRTARLNTLLQQISADFLDRIDDDRIPFLTVTGVEVDSDLNKAQVFISTFEDESADADILEALADYRKPLRGEIAQQARLRKTPDVVFLFDPAVREGARIETILSELNLSPSDETPAAEGQVDAGDGDDGNEAGDRADRDDGDDGDDGDTESVES